ncbi:hypothetical protein CC1G_15110 [Coprinopsis cinerea okayama7|uniref:Uncharacterized protein n=1 Tax=Coprinopsis cinerea (strain Okayama-7 / 130 / ATCC MYA-4618 / FGSC 9003) TaxID=240176 RepID=D6RPH2_COPC7|nr:hypothetical protein CC1G_15110 [Coprinopsis cinerea okayama7\|eukprot:XP_002910469.1 hypothetical protein CC1G_15110 [Coprinopsis cinerea okayama7\
MSTTRLARFGHKPAFPTICLMPSISQDKGNPNSENNLFHHVHSIYGPLCVHPPARGADSRYLRTNPNATRLA